MESSFRQKPHSKRVVDVINLLIQKGKIPNIANFCEQIDFLETSLSAIRNGKRDAPQSLIVGLNEKFNISRDFIYKGIEPMFISETVNEPTVEYKKNPMESRVSDLERQVKELTLMMMRIQSKLIESADIITRTPMKTQKQSGQKL